MRVLELSLRSYRVFEEVELELPARVIGIFGQNASGKSTLMESVAVALYGVKAARTDKREIRTHGLLADCLVRLVFEHGGQQYEVRRTLRGKGSMPEAELYGGGLVLASGTTEVDAEIARLLHMDLRVFRASVFAEQKQLDAFSDVTKGKRKEMVLRLLGIRPVDDAIAAARKAARDTKGNADRLAGALPDLAEMEAQLKEAKDVARGAKARSKSAADELKRAVATEKQARKAFDESDRARQRVEKIVVAREAAAQERGQLAARRGELADRLEQLGADLAGLSALEEELVSLEGVSERLKAGERQAEAARKLREAETRLGALPEIDAARALAELQAAEEELLAAERSVAEAGARRDHVAGQVLATEERLARTAEADPSQPCPTCGQKLGAGFTAYVEHCREEAAAAKKALASGEKALRDAEAKRAKAEARRVKAAKAGEAVRATAAQRSQLAERVEELGREVAALAEQFGGEAPDVDALRAAVGRAKDVGERIAELGVERKRRTEAERDLAKVDTRIGELDERIARLDAEAAELAFDPEEHARLREERDEAARLLEEAREDEQEATAQHNEARNAVSRLEGQIAEARKIEATVVELKGEARYLDRVSLLLKGFRDHLVSRIGPELSREAEALFRELTNHEYDDLRIDEDTLAIQIADGDAYHPIERFSGSETDLANLALRVAISMHLSRMSGADVGMMVLDEVLGALDAERKDLMVQTMGRLSGRFHQLFVITHAEQVKDQFPASIDVRKVGRRRSVAVLT